jgi:antagonist of KipI
MSIQVVEPGFLTTVQDLGRWGYVHLGIGVSGAMDPFAMRAANVLVGNEPGSVGRAPGAAGLEITVGGPVLSFQESCAIAVTGGDLGPRLNGTEIESWRAYLVPAGSTLEFTGRRSGARAYLAVSGGIDVRPWLGSRSTYLMAKTGGLDGRALRAGDRLPVGKSAASLSMATTPIPPGHRPLYSAEPVLRVILGPHTDRFTEEGIQAFLGGRYEITAESNRMAFRLEGPVIAHSRGADVSSCGIPLAGIQVPGVGQPILFMADKPQAGGYPQIAALIQADIPVAAQCLPGEAVRFRVCSFEEARESLRRQEDALRAVVEERDTSPWRGEE